MECVVVGGGIIGMLTARELARAGCRVRIIERGTLGGESSWAGGGILSPVCPWRAPEALTRLAGWSQRHYPGLAAELLAETGIDPEWTRSGLLILDSDEQDKAGDWATHHHVTVELLDDPAAIGALEPACRPAARALWLPEVAQVRNPRLLRALRASIERQGVAVHEHTAVTGILHEDGVAYGVGTAREVIRGDAVIVAAGAWSAGVMQALDVRVDVKPVRGQMLLYRAAPGLVRRILLSAGRYVIPRRDGRVLVGSTVEDAGFDKSTTEEARRELRQAAESLVPAFARCEVERQWSGLRPGSETDIPYIGAAPGIRGLYVNAGHFRNGLLLAPASAVLIADAILGRKGELDPGPFALNR